MLDIKFIRENPDLVKENIRKKFQNAKLPLVDEVIALDSERREAINEGEALKAERNKISKANGPLFGKLKKCADEAEKAALQAEIDANNAAVKANAERMARLEEKKANAEAAMNKLLLVIPQMIDESVPIGPDDSCNVEVERFGEPKTPDFPIPYHTEIMERFDGVDMDAAARVSGNGFYYLMGDIARLHSAVTAYGRDFMIDKGFTYCIPPFMIHGNVVEGVMSQTDMDAMMYKIEGEDLYLIGTSEHSMIGKFIDQILPEDKLPQTLTSYSPCFRKEKGSPFKSAYDMMNYWGANHGAISYGHIGADLITMCSMLRIPVSMHNVPADEIFRPAAWNAFGMDKEGADYRACANFGPLYGTNHK